MFEATTEDINDALWDYSTLMGLNTTIILLLLVRVVIISYQSAMKRNRLTYHVHFWFLMN